MISRKITIISIVIIFVVFLTAIYFSIHSQKKIVYVDNSKLFEGFNMTKELKKAGEAQFNSQKTLLDSLYRKIQSPTTSPSEKQQLMPEFISKKEELEKFNSLYASEQSAKIWSRIKTYSKDYLNQNNYGLIIGDDKGTNVLATSPDNDVTNELIKYINNKYEGNK